LRKSSITGWALSIASKEKKKKKGEREKEIGKGNEQR